MHLINETSLTLEIITWKTAESLSNISFLFLQNKKQLLMTIYTFGSNINFLMKTDDIFPKLFFCFLNLNCNNNNDNNNENTIVLIEREGSRSS